MVAILAVLLTILAVGAVALVAVVAARSVAGRSLEADLSFAAGQEPWARAAARAASTHDARVGAGATRMA